MTVVSRASNVVAQWKFNVLYICTPKRGLLSQYILLLYHLRLDLQCARKRASRKRVCGQCTGRIQRKSATLVSDHSLSCKYGHRSRFNEKGEYADVCKNYAKAEECRSYDRYNPVNTRVYRPREPKQANGTKPSTHNTGW